MASPTDPPNLGLPDTGPEHVFAAASPTQTPMGGPGVAPDRPRGFKRLVSWAPAWLVILAFLVAVVAPVGYFVHLPYYSVGPGPSVNVLQLIQARGAKTYGSKGKLLLTTVSESINTVNVWDAVYAWIDPNTTLLSEKAVIPPGETSREVDIENQLEMDDSKYAAEIAAFRALGLTVPKIPGARVLSVVQGLPAFGKLRAQDIIVSVDGVRVKDPDAAVTLLRKHKIGETVTIGFTRGRSNRSVKVKTVSSPPRAGQKPYSIVGVNLEPAFRLPKDLQIDTQNIVGPSGGMIIALSIYDALTPADLTGGHIIAGTGTIAILDNGQAVIGDIGGIEEKVRTASAHGADIFLAPADQAAAARKVAPKSMRVIGVNTFAQALAVLKALPPVRKAS